MPKSVSADDTERDPCQSHSHHSERRLARRYVRFRITATAAMGTQRFRNRELRDKVAAMPIDTLSATGRGSDLYPKRPLHFYTDRFYVNAWRCGDSSDSEPRGRQHHRGSASVRVRSSRPPSPGRPLAQPPIFERHTSAFEELVTVKQTDIANDKRSWSLAELVDARPKKWR
jgi:hypothetical protein